MSDTEHVPPLTCKDCARWYGAEDDELGPCMVKHARAAPRFLTHGEYVCDEPEVLAEHHARFAPPAP